MTDGYPVRAVDAAAYTVPTGAPEADGTLAWNSTTIVVVEVSAGPVTGLGWTYAHAACVPLITGTLAGLVCDRDVRDVPAAWEAMRTGVRNLGRVGLVSYALSAVETAMWDAAARLVELPLVRLLGRARDTVPVYGSGGFTTDDGERLAEQLAGWVADGIPRVKIKIGESFGRCEARDLRRVGAARAAVGPDTELYVDANGGYQPAQAIRVGRQLSTWDVRWFEEPVTSDDPAGLRQVRDAVDADVTAGEYGTDLPYFARMVDCVDCLQVDATRCGGYAEWLRAAALAAARGRDVSGHCAPNLTAHVAAATPNLRHLEWFADHDRIERLLFDGVLDPTGGVLRPDLTVPGHGLSLRRADAEPYRVA
ncbi:enolase C-terminal domain-like protein [Actinocatenispora rupis]|uniref:Mandelate racemase n=1 Tax=Actinocatenispora rupis TaxID=519421 RepID=A0A8J3J974_9ACTN|nr:enolase C-terminal domain-like protein [Actinocatenispora rupis]GID12399.1 mandelate racemase [Actinocatenispora rupis]